MSDYALMRRLLPRDLVGSQREAAARLAAALYAVPGRPVEASACVQIAARRARSVRARGGERPAGR
jgi:hypothetical protein